mmetsp:Transcript_38111/g.83693  ORF Transcript_38111/g.83693 Transcript_38111/m.83693 type:complete len:649 (-) Transcript_38111:185-2131(-)
MLQYDDNGFYFFALSGLSLFLVPSWYTVLGKVYGALTVRDDAIGAVARTSDEQVKAAKLKQSSKGLGSLKKKEFLVRFGITLALTVLFVYLVTCVSEDGEVSSFDPFSILEVDSGADNKSIKKAYKTMSLKYHPDKNPNNPAAEAKFMMVAKAYESLTDPTAKENYEKYGNPDGKQSLEVSIGLPSFLLDTSNRNFVLMAYLIIMVGIIPFCVWRYYSHSSKFGEKDVMYSTYSWYHQNLGEHTVVRALPEIYAGSAEFRTRNKPLSEEGREIQSIMKTLKSQMQKPKFKHPVCVKGNLLLHAHLARKVGDLSDKFGDDLNYMLRCSGSLIDAMISVCQHQDALDAATNCIKFGQYVTQALRTKDSTLLQLPNFTQDDVERTKKASSGKITTIAEYIKTPDAEKPLSGFDDGKKEDVLKCCAIIPNLDVETKVFVDDDEDTQVYEGDLLTVQVKLTRTNLKEGEKAGLVHAPYFPYPKQEAWWVILGTKDGKIIDIQKVTKADRTVEHEIKFLAPRKGEYEFDLHVVSNAYVGLDQKLAVDLEVSDPSTLPEYKVHPDDAELDDEPTLFEEMMMQNVEEDSDSDEDDEDDSDSDDDDDDEDDERGIRELSAADRKKEELRRARQRAAAAEGDDSSDDDSDVEEVYNEK